MFQSAEERTEQPTPSRREEARQQGRVPRSRDLAAALALLAGFSALRFHGPALGEELKTLLSERLARAVSAGGQQDFVELGTILAGLFLRTILALGPMLGTVALAGVACGAIQSGFSLRPSVISPDLGRAHPLSGIERLVSLSSVGRGVFAALKILLVGWLLLAALRSLAFRGGEILGKVTGPSAARSAWASSWETIVGFGMQLSIVLVVLAIVDYAFQYWLHERSLRMTPQELREELLRTEGSGLTKDRRRRLWGRVHAGEQSVNPVSGARGA